MIDIDKIYADASAVSSTKIDQAVDLLQPLLEAQRENTEAAEALIHFIKNHKLPTDICLEILSTIYDANYDKEGIVLLIGSALEAATDIDDLNSAPPDHPLFADVIKNLSGMAAGMKGHEKEAVWAEALSSAARLAGRQYDRLAEEQYGRLVALLPDESWTHYNQGLFYKTRGRFEEGVTANQNALAHSDEEQEAYMWNLGICATGARMGDVALDVWKRMGNKIELGRFELPEGGYPSCKVKLAEHPLAERTAGNDHPGLEETIWIQRLSPCHGIIRSVLYQDLGVDYGDVILFDGAPITYHTYKENKIPVFPHLATLVRSNYHFYDFAAIQNQPGIINKLDQAFEDDIVIYSHTDKYKVLCAACWRNEDLDHAKHTETEEKNIVTGRIAAPPEITSSALLKRLDALREHTSDYQIYAPDLSSTAGFSDRAERERRRFKMIRGE